MSDEACLDRQVWGMLTGRLARLATGGEAAKRIDPRYGPFAAARDEGEQAQAALAALLDLPDDEVWLVEPGRRPAPPGTLVLREAVLLQMVAGAEGEDFSDDDIVPLGEADAAEMTELALATRPGPWSAMTHRYGPFYGIRREGRLAAMAGERMLPGPGFAEVSAVCTWPELRGQGMGGRLIRRLMAGLRARGDRPYLHTYADNEAAIGLYRKLGFVERRTMILTVLGRV